MYGVDLMACAGRKHSEAIMTIRPAACWTPAGNVREHPLIDIRGGTRGG